MASQQMNFVTFSKLAETNQQVVMYREILVDHITPIGIMTQLSHEMQEGTLLESGLQPTEDGRYSYLAFGLIAQLTSRGSMITLRKSDEVSTYFGDPFVALRQLVAEYYPTHLEHELLKMQGAVGFVTYDAVRLKENIPDRHANESNLPDLLFNCYHTTLIFDHVQHKLVLAKRVEITHDLRQIFDETEQYLQNLIAKINGISQAPILKNTHSVDIQDPHVDVSDKDFIQLITQAKHHISLGDAFQIVLSRCFERTYTAHPFDIYRALRNVSPAPYMFYFPMDQGVLMGASPEKMITVRQKIVEINPIAGTRGKFSVEEEEKNALDLLQDEKELAEHRMLVDLARNDLGMVCKPGSVYVKALLQVKHFSHVSHLTSIVVGQLAENKDALDALQATFPAGTVSGAPKIRAMEVIDTLETSRRGIYGGAFCRVDALGNLDSCIAIRMAILHDGKAMIRTGAGIVADSDPTAEATETRQKAQGLLTAIALAEEGLAC